MELIDYLLKHGSNPNLMDDQDHTPLFMTMNTKIIQMLDMGLELEKWNKIKRRPSNMSVPSKSTYGRIQNTILPRPITWP